MWRRRAIVPDDTSEARELRHDAVVMRAHAAAEGQKARAQAPELRRIAHGLIDRLEQNHFIELMYRPRESR